jgi:hypothetical protein
MFVFDGVDSTLPHCSIQPLRQSLSEGIGLDSVNTSILLCYPEWTFIIPSFRLFTDLVTDSLTEFSYDAELAGLEYSFASHTQGLWVTLSGYNDKLPVLAHHVLERIKDIKVDPERLRVIKEHVCLNVVSYLSGVAYVFVHFFRWREIGRTSSSGKRIEFQTISDAIL